MTTRLKCIFFWMCTDLFLASFFVYACIFVLELLRKGIVTNYIQANSILLCCLVSGVGMLFFASNGKETEYKADMKNNSAFFFLVIIACVFGITAFHYAKNAGIFRIPFTLGAISSMIVLGMCIVKRDNKY